MSLDKGFNIIESEVRLDLGNISLLGRVEGEFDSNKILHQIIQIAKNSVRELLRELLDLAN